MRTFRKYANRKLYSTQDHKYVNLEQIHSEVKNGLTVIVLDHKTGEDVTLDTLKQAVLKCNNFSLEGLQDLIREEA